MYEKPQLNHVGKAQDVILGIYLAGSDLDTTYVPYQGEYADDFDPAE
jgi:hypothetical protein